MERREFITLLDGAAAAWPLAARAQGVGKIPRIGYLSPGSASPGPLAYHDEFQRRLRELGYVDGRNIVIEYRFAEGKFDRLDQLAAELVRLNVDIIVSVVTQASLAAKNATSTTPIVVLRRELCLTARPSGPPLMSALGQKRTFSEVCAMSALLPIADIGGVPQRVRRDAVERKSRHPSMLPPPRIFEGFGSFQL